MLFDRLYDWARVQPHKPALTHNGAVWSYGDFVRAIDGVAGFLAAQDLPRSGTAPVVATDTFDGWCLVLALRALGYDTACARSVRHAATAGLRDVVFVVAAEPDDAAMKIRGESSPGSRIVVVPRTAYARLPPGELPPSRRSPRWGGYVFLSSFSSPWEGARQKKCAWNAAYDEARNSARARALEIGPHTVYNATSFALWTPSGFNTPTVVWQLGGSVVTDQTEGHLRNAFRQGTNLVALLAQDLKEILDTGSAPEPGSESITVLVSGGSLPLALAERVIATPGLNLLVTAGSLETGILLRGRYSSRVDPFWLEPVAERTVEIVDEDDSVCAPGREGLLRVRLKDSDARPYDPGQAGGTRQYRDGFFYTGDLAVQRADGRIRILGRIDDFINFQGHKKAQAPLERAIERHLGVDEVCLFTGGGDGGVDELLIAIRSEYSLTPGQMADLAYRFDSFERVRLAVFDEFPRARGDRAATSRIALRKLAFDRAHTIR